MLSNLLGELCALCGRSEADELLIGPLHQHESIYAHTSCLKVAQTKRLECPGCKKGDWLTTLPYDLLLEHAIRVGDEETALLAMDTIEDIGHGWIREAIKAEMPRLLSKILRQENSGNVFDALIRAGDLELVEWALARRSVNEQTISASLAQVQGEKNQPLIDFLIKALTQTSLSQSLEDALFRAIQSGNTLVIKALLKQVHLDDTLLCKCITMTISPAPNRPVFDLLMQERPSLTDCQATNTLIHALSECSHHALPPKTSLEILEDMLESGLILSTHQLIILLSEIQEDLVWPCLDVLAGARTFCLPVTK